MYFGYRVSEVSVKMKTSKSLRNVPRYPLVVLRNQLKSQTCLMFPGFNVVTVVEMEELAKPGPLIKLGPTSVGVCFEAAPSRLTAILRWLGRGWEENDGQIKKFKKKMLLKILHPCHAAIKKKRAFQTFEALRHLVCIYMALLYYWIIHYDLSQWIQLPIPNSKVFV